MARIHTISHLPLQTRVRNTFANLNERERKIRLSDELSCAKQSAQEELITFLSDNACSYEAKAIAMRFSELGLNFKEELMKRYKEGNGEIKSNIVKTLLALGGSYIDLIEEILSSSENKFCFSVLKSLQRDEKANFLSQCRGHNVGGFLSEEGINALIEIGDRNPDFILSSLLCGEPQKSNFQDRDFRYNDLFFKVIRSLEDLKPPVRVPTKYLKLIYNLDLAYYYLNVRWHFLKEHIKKYPEDKQTVEGLLLNVVNCNEKRNGTTYTPAYVDSFEHYSEFLGVKGFNRILSFVCDGSPLKVGCAINTLSSKPFSKNHQEKLCNLISEELLKGNKLPFAYLAYNSGWNISIRKIFLKVLSLKDLHLEMLLSDDRIPVFAYRSSLHNSDSLSEYKKYKPGKCSDSTELLIKYTFKGQNKTIRTNAARLLTLMKDSELKEAVESSEYKKELVKSVGLSHEVKVA